MIDTIPSSRVAWLQAHRIIRTVFPPIDLFEDLADPADWEALASAEAKTNPRVMDQIGDLGLVPVERRVGGEGASFLMAPFVHVSTDRPGRFTTGTFGVYSAGDSEEVAIREVAYHHARFMSSTDEEPGWTSQFRRLVGSLDADLHDVSDIPGICDPDDLTVGQDVGQQLRAAGSDGVLYPSVRSSGGSCVGLFWPDVIDRALAQAGQYDFHYDGDKVDRVRRHDDKQILSLV